MLTEAGCSSIGYQACHLPSYASGGKLARAAAVRQVRLLHPPLSSSGIGTLLAGVTALQQVPGAAGGVGGIAFDALGGAVNRVKPGATAFVHRNALFGAVHHRLDRRRGSAGISNQHTWLRQYWSSMRPYASGQAYQNYVDPDLTNWQQAYYGATTPAWPPSSRSTTRPACSPSPRPSARAAPQPRPRPAVTGYQPNGPPLVRCQALAPVAGTRLPQPSPGCGNVALVSNQGWSALARGRPDVDAGLNRVLVDRRDLLGGERGLRRGGQVLLELRHATRPRSAPTSSARRAAPTRWPSAPASARGRRRSR